MSTRPGHYGGRRYQHPTTAIVQAARQYRNEMDTIMAWLRANDLDWAITIMTAPEYERLEQYHTGQRELDPGDGQGGVLYILGDGAPLLQILNSTEPLNQYDWLTSVSGFIGLLQVVFGDRAGYEMVNHYTLEIFGEM